jgi:hypothetical protein
MLNAILRDYPSNQRQLEGIVRVLFPKENIQTNARYNAELINPNTGLSLELDVWIPRLHLCFEFQDVYHYTSTYFSQINLYDIQRRDAHKQEMDRMKEDTLVSVPFWWDGQKESLLETVNFQRPDIMVMRTHMDIDIGYGGNGKNIPVPTPIPAPIPAPLHIMMNAGIMMPNISSSESFAIPLNPPAGYLEGGWVKNMMASVFVGILILCVYIPDLATSLIFRTNS